MARCSSSLVYRALVLWLFFFQQFSAALPSRSLQRDDDISLSTVPDYATRYGRIISPCSFAVRPQKCWMYMAMLILNTAPLIWLHSEDPFRPADILQHVRHTTPTVQFQPISGLPDLSLDNLAWLNDKASGDKGPVALTANDDITALPAWFLGETPDASGRLHNATACVVILVPSARDPAYVDAFYFYFYSYDRGANLTQVLPPLKSLLGDIADGMHYGNHVGDW